MTGVQTCALPILEEQSAAVLALGLGVLHVILGSLNPPRADRHVALEIGRLLDVLGPEKITQLRGLLGGKGANLADMTRLGVPVPHGFTATTEACNAYLSAGGELPEGLWEQALEAIAVLEEQTGKGFGDPSAPLLVSCRSGAKFSMPEIGRAHV